MHFESLKCPQILYETHAEIASMEKSASHLHILRLQNKAHWDLSKSILQSLCTEAGTFNSIFECSQLTRIIIGFSVTGHLCHIIVD